MEDDVLARPRLRHYRDAHFCSVKGLRGLYETRASFAPQLEDAKGQTQPDSEWDDLQGAVGRLSHESGVLETGVTHKPHSHFDRAIRFNPSVISRMLASIAGLHMGNYVGNFVSPNKLNLIVATVY